MYSIRILYNLFLLSGILTLLLGLYLKFFSKVSNADFEYTRYDVKESSQFIEGNGTIVLGLLLLFASCITLMIYNEEVKKKIELRKKESLENNKE